MELRRRGLTAPQLAQKSGGEISSSSVRSWVAGTALPTPKNALAAVGALGDHDAAVRVLLAWGMVDAAEVFEIEPVAALPAAVVSGSEPVETFRYEVPPESPRAVPIGWEVCAVIVSRIGTKYLARAASGMLLLIEPVESVESMPWPQAFPPPEVTDT